jgi:hypothetical protein
MAVVAIWSVVLVASAGTARAVPALGVAPSSDGYGVVVGSADAPAQLVTFIEPQCPHCAQFESDYGDKIARYVGNGRLAMTYRPLTFLDEARHNDASARISNALFLAADPATSAIAYQAFVQDLYRHQDSTGGGPSNDDLAAMARKSGVSGSATTRIERGDSGVDPVAMDDANTTRVVAENPEGRRTPTVYDLKAERVVDIHDPGWLDALFTST